MKRTIQKLSVTILLVTMIVASILKTPMVFAEAPNRDTNWVPSHGSYVVENDMVKFVSDSGHDYQGEHTNSRRI